MRERSGGFESYADLSGAILSRQPVFSLEGFGDDERRVAAGVAVYRNNVRSAFTRALGDEFPAVQKLVGEEFFKYLAHEYFHAEPPSSPLVTRYGDRLPQFLGSFEPVAHLPYLGDVARLENLWLASYHAAEAATLTPADILASLGDDVGAVRFSLHPSVRLFSSGFPAVTIWRHNRASENPPPLKLGSGGEKVLIARPDREVIVTDVSEGTWQALVMLKKGESVDAALETGLAAQPDLQPADCLQTLFSGNIITAIH